MGHRSPQKEEGTASNLSRQVGVVKNFALDELGTELKTDNIYSGIGSGLSFTRKGLDRMIDHLLDGTIPAGSVLLITFKDRLARFGVELIEKIANFRQVQIKYIR